MDNNEEFNFKTIMPNLIATIIAILVVLLVVSIKTFFEKEVPECTQADLYETTEWNVCTEEGVQTRNLIEKENFSCKNPGKVDIPELERNCTYIPPCNNEKEPCSQNYSYLFKKGVKEHTTIIENGNYSNKNHNNLAIIPHGEFKDIRLTIIADIRPEKIDEYYYVFFGIDSNYATPRVIGTTRIKDNRLDLKDYGVFQGTETPRTLKFDLKNVKLARESTSTKGSEVKNYIEILNTSPGQELKMTLFLADGNSMTTDINHRIFGVITDAWLEYECEENEECSIERIPSIQEKTEINPL